MLAHYGETHYDYVPGVFRASYVEQWCQGFGNPADSPARDEGDHLEVRASPEPQRQRSDLTDSSSTASATTTTSSHTTSTAERGASSSQPDHSSTVRAPSNDRARSASRETYRCIHCGTAVTKAGSPFVGEIGLRIHMRQCSQNPNLKR